MRRSGGRRHDDRGMAAARAARRRVPARPARLVRRGLRARVERLTLPAADLLRRPVEEAGHDDVLSALLALAEQVGVADRRDAMFPGERINVTEDRAVLHTALRLPAPTRALERGRPGRRPRRAGRAPPGLRIRRQGPLRRVDRRHRRADPHGGQHRHRRLRPRAGDGLRGAGALPPGRARVPVHQQHRPHRRRARRWPGSTPRRPCSSSPARPSPRSRR